MSNSNLVMALTLLIATSGLAVRGKTSTMLALINFNALMIMYFMVTSSGTGAVSHSEDLMDTMQQQAQAAPDNIGKQLVDVALNFQTVSPGPDNTVAAKSSATPAPGSTLADESWGN